MYRYFGLRSWFVVNVGLVFVFYGLAILVCLPVLFAISDCTKTLSSKNCSLLLILIDLSDFFHMFTSI